MNSPAAVKRPISNYSFSSFQNPRISKAHPSSSYKLPSNFIQNPNKCLKNCSPSSVNSSRTEFRLNILSPRLLRVRALSNDAQSITTGSFGAEDGEVREPSFVEFITSERVKVVAMLAMALALCNADRVVMSVAIVPLSMSYGWRQSFAGVVQSSFLWGYLISPIAGGTLVDYYGGKVVMAWGVALWSLATFLTPWAAETSLWALLAVRILLGIAEGVALPCMNNMIARWFPQTERSQAVGLAMAGFQLGSAIGLMLSPILMSHGGVFGPFIIFGLCGFLWVLGFFVILSWMPIYFKTIYHVDLRQAAWFSAVPWSMMALVGYFAGVWSDLLIRHGMSVTLTRKIMQVLKN